MKIKVIIICWFVYVTPSSEFTHFSDFHVTYN